MHVDPRHVVSLFHLQPLSYSQKGIIQSLCILCVPPKLHNVPGAFAWKYYHHDPYCRFGPVQSCGWPFIFFT